MLFFITMTEVNIDFGWLFKYISCYSLSWIRLCGLFHFRTFKYISCYSLSIAEEWDGTKEWHLNTSHVILYQNNVQTLNFIPEFKYISCYSLSSAQDSFTFIGQTFKYISCYSLSTYTGYYARYLLHLNTSHVILYPHGRNLWKNTRQDLNTSHVILYLFCPNCLKTFKS